MKLLTYTQVANALGVSNDTVRRLVARGELEVVHVTPSRPQVSADELERFVDARRSRAVPQRATSPIVHIGGAGRGRRVSDFRQRLRDVDHA